MKSFLVVAWSVSALLFINSDGSPSRYLQLVAALPEHAEHLTQAEIEQYMLIQEAPAEVKSCANHGKNSTAAYPTDCMCYMACAKESGSTDPMETQHDKKCRTYRRHNDCGCKPPRY